MTLTRKLCAFFLALALALTAASALGATVEPEETELERLAGGTFHATLGAWDGETFTVTVYAEDRYDRDDVKKLAAGDVLLAGGRVFKIASVTAMDGHPMVKCENGEEIWFDFARGEDDEMLAFSTDDDRLYMHAVAVLHLPAAADITLTDASNPDLPDPVVTRGIDNILKVKAEKEETSNGIDYYAATVSLNRALEIEAIRIVFDVAQ